jgi:PAS domain S-box-containing protein
MKRGRGLKGFFLHKLKPLPWPLMFIFLFLTVAIAVSGYFYYQKQKKNVIREQITQLQTIADLKAADIQQWLGERLGDARLIAENHILTAELLAFLKDRSAGPRQESILGWMESMQKNYNIQNVMLLDRFGEVILTLTNLNMAIGLEGKKLLETVYRSKEAALSDLHHSTLAAYPHLDAVAPLLDTGTVAGFVFMRFDPSQFLFPNIQSWPTPSTSAETLLVRRDGDSVLYLNELRHRKNTAMKLRLPLASKEIPAVMAILGKTGAVSGTDYRGIAVWSVLKPVPDSNWFIVAKVDREEIERPLRRSALAIFLVSLSLVLAAALMILFLWQRQAGRFLLRQLEAQRESEDKFKHVFEAANVAKSITLPTGEIHVNQAFCDMLGFTQEELQLKTWQELTPADEIEATQQIVGLLLKGEKDSARFNKRYVHKNGSHVWADVSVVLRRDQAGKPLHFITTIVDITQRKQAEAALRESEKKLRETQEMARLGHWRWDIKTGLVEWSEEVFRIFHLDPNLFTPQIDSILALSPWPEDHERDQELIRRAMETHEKGTYEQRFLLPDKSIGYYHSTFQGNYDNGGNLISIIGTVLDITERKRAEMDLQILSSRNQAMLEAIPDIIMEVDTDKVYSWANHAGIDFFGADVIGRKASYYFAGEQKTYLTVKPIFNGKEDVIYVESWQRRRDGEKRLLAWWCRVLKDESGNVTGALSSARDITEIQHAEEALRKSELKFRATIVNLDEGYYSVTLDGKLLEHNQAFNRILGFDIHEDLKGVQLPDFWQDPDQRREYLKAFAASGAITNYQIDAKTRTGGKITILANAHLVKDENNRPQWIEGVFLDISERIRAEAEIRRLNEELEQRVLQRTAQLETANKELEAFSYSVSHDLRAPLRAIDGFSRIVLEEYAPKLDDEGRRLLDVITANTRKMGQLIDDLLAFSRLSRQQMAFAAVDLAALADDVFSELKNTEKGRQIEFKIGAHPAAFGDRSMLRHVLLNLFSNALKFTRPRAKARIEFGAQTAIGETIYCVKDNGVGFDMKYAHKIFGVFQRLHGTNEFEGTGVGLAIVQRIVLRHGGRVWAKSAARGGATFYFTLPVEAKPGTEEPAAGPPVK